MVIPSRAIVMLLLIFAGGCASPLPRSLRNSLTVTVQRPSYGRRRQSPISHGREAAIQTAVPLPQANFLVPVANISPIDNSQLAQTWLLERLPPVSDERGLTQEGSLDDQLPTSGNSERSVLDFDPAEEEPVCHLLAPDFDEQTLAAEMVASKDQGWSDVWDSQFASPSTSFACEAAHRIGRDHLHYYSPSSLATLVLIFGAGGAMAHTAADKNLLDQMQENLLSDAAHEYREFIIEHKFLGEGYVLLPAYALIAYAGQGLGESPLAPEVGEWGERSFRAIVVGAPPLLAAQLLTGGSRPGETEHGSHWRPLADDNGVSGHAFIGAIPFLSAAKMSDRFGMKVLLISASMLPALSRITEEAHYPSQVILGWSMAYLAATAVDATNHDFQTFTLAPWASGDAVGIGGMWQR